MSRKVCLSAQVTAFLLTSGSVASHAQDPAASLAQVLEKADAARAAERYREADDLYADAAEQARKANDLPREEAALLGRCVCLDARCDLVGFRDVSVRLLDVQRRMGNPDAAARTEADVGAVAALLGDRERCLYHLSRALAAFEAKGLRRELAQGLATAGVTAAATGDYLRGLKDATRSVALWRELLTASGDDKDAAAASRAGLAYGLHALGGLRSLLGDAEGAARSYEEAVELLAADDPGSALHADCICGLAIARASSDDPPANARAREELVRALDRFEGHADAPGEILALLALGDLDRSAGRHTDALRFFERARARAPAGGGLAARALLRMADASFQLDRRKEARSLYAAAIEETSVLGVTRLQERAHAGAAEVMLADKEPLEALRHARLAASFQALVAEGLAEDQIVDTEVFRNELTDIAVTAALEANRTAEAVEFMERGRAAALLAILGAREALLAVDVPEDLRARYAEAAARHAGARTRVEFAVAGGNRSDVAEATEALKAAERTRREAVKGIDGVLHEGSRVKQSVSATLADIQSALWPREALVLYTLLPKEAVAAVVTRADARIVRLGDRRALEEACDALCAAKPGDSEPALGRLKDLGRRLLDPLGLPADIQVLLVSPDGVLGRVPFPAVAAESGRQELKVALVPSGSVYRLLGQDRALRGTTVLALADPAYAAAQEETRRIVARRSSPLVSLPATRAEIAAIRGPEDKVLLGADATEERLREAARSRERWRAIHLACHAVIDMGSPSLSALAITPSVEGDGFLSALEILKTRLPTELIVLSACETGLGPVREGEGILGFTRAFMIAGAPRVVVSLWKVDDDATGALMARFYALWNPRDGTHGMGPADALRAAQTFVRSHEKWRHPYYWAAWVLWGLPE